MRAAAVVTSQARAGLLFDLDPELAEALAPEELHRARPRALVPVVEIPAGPWSPDALATDHPRAFALLVVEGLIMREELLAGSTTTELVGPGDLVDINRPTDSLVRCVVRWSAPERAAVALLDDRVLAAMRIWPQLGRVLFARSARRAGRMATHRAISQLPRVDQRLLAFLAHIAERWGRVTPAGVVIPMHFTHETLGRLIGARRPTVSLAVKELTDEGLIERRRDGAWLVLRGALELLGGEPGADAAWQPAEARAVAVPEHAVPVRQVAQAGLTPDDIAALRERVSGLLHAHADRMRRCAESLERARSARAALVDARADGDAFLVRSP